MIYSVTRVCIIWCRVPPFVSRNTLTLYYYHATRRREEEDESARNTEMIVGGQVMSSW